MLYSLIQVYCIESKAPGVGVNTEKGEECGHEKKERDGDLLLFILVCRSG